MPREEVRELAQRGALRAWRRLLWMTWVHALRWFMRLRPSEPGATIVVVNWNGRRYLRDCIAALVARTGPDDEIMVIDNHSLDGSAEIAHELAGAHPRVGLRRLHFNHHHDLALQLGFLHARRRYLVAFDVDAFPVDDRWLEHLRGALDSGARVAGVEAYRPYAHPCCMMITRDRFLARRHTFRSHWGDGSDLGARHWDVGERISIREHPHVALWPPTHQFGPGWVGTTWAPLCYHNFYGTRHTHRRSGPPAEEVIVDGVTAAEAIAAWTTAVASPLYPHPPA